MTHIFYFLLYIYIIQRVQFPKLVKQLVNIIRISQTLFLFFITLDTFERGDDRSTGQDLGSPHHRDRGQKQNLCMLNVFITLWVLGSLLTKEAKKTLKISPLFSCVNESREVQFLVHAD